MRSPFPAHSPSGHVVGDCWCQDSATGPTLLAATALVEEWRAMRHSWQPNGMSGLADRLDALETLIRKGESP